MGAVILRHPPRPRRVHLTGGSCSRESPGWAKPIVVTVSRATVDCATAAKPATRGDLKAAGGVPVRPQVIWFAVDQARMSWMTRPWTSVRRKSRPA